MRRRPWFPWLLALVCGVLVVRAGVRDRGVITDHLEFGRRLVAGEDLYAPYLESKPLHAPYPPSFGLLTAPFSLLPERGARWAWAGVQALALVLVLEWLRRELCARWPARDHDWILLISLALGARYVLRDTHGGGGNLINLALVALTLSTAAQGRSRRAGVWLGFSLATKPVAVLFVPLLWMFGHRRAATTAVASALAFALLSLALSRFDPSGWQRWAAGTFAYATQDDVFAPPALGFPPFSWMNQCLRCAVARYVGDVPPDLAAEVTPFVPGLGCGAAVVVAVRTVLALALLLATAAVVWRRRTEGRARLPAVAATFALSLLLSPISWKAHHVALLPAFAVLLAAGSARRRGPWLLAAAYAAACLLGEEVTGKAVKELLQSSYVVTLGTVALWAFTLREAGIDPASGEADADGRAAAATEPPRGASAAGAV